MPDSLRSSVPRTEVSLGVLRAGARRAVEAGGRVADLRGDAWGHGLLPVGREMIASGAASLLVDEDDLARCAAAGLPAQVDGEADIDPLLIYGLPGSGGLPAMRLYGTVMSTKPLRAGDAVSYGYTHRAEADTTVALVTGGYAQGIVRALGNRGHVEIGGRLRPIVGRVAMDVCVADLGGEDVESGSEATYFGGAGPARELLGAWTAATGLTIGELIAVVGAKTERRWTE